MTLLDEILARKALEVEGLRSEPGELELRRRAEAADPPRDFAAALRDGSGPRVIAEFKRASPSAGSIRTGADAAEVARAYARGGARALSVLTDRDFFSGSLDDLRAARAAVSLPVLRKDFTLDPLQLYEARSAGADAALLIVAALDDTALERLLEAARRLGLAALVEVHTRAELERALTAGAELVGVNNRDLHTMKTDPEVTRRLLAHVDGRTLVSESGLSEPEVLRDLASAGVDAFLIGEALMKSDDPERALRRLVAGEDACA